jgi:hypothetical protein
MDVETSGTVTAAATIVAVGAALSAVGLVEWSIAHSSGPMGSSPFDNSWLWAGLVLMGTGVALSVAIIAVRVARIVAAERWRAHLTQFARRGQLFLDEMAKGQSVPTKALADWYEETREQLGAHDVTGSLVVRFEATVSGFGTPAGMDHVWLRSHTDRLVELVEEIRN